MSGETPREKAQAEWRQRLGVEEPKDPFMALIDDMQFLQHTQCEEFKKLKVRLGELEKRLDMHASTQHNLGVDSLKAWRQKGGYATAQKKTAKERSDEMREVAKARWARRKKQAGQEGK